MMLTADRLRHLLFYDPDTGMFTWLNPLGTVAKRGDPAGAKPDHGYIRLRVEGRLYKAHRLAWLYVYGKFPDAEIDHINRDGLDNRIGNLREATRSQNMMNGIARKNNKAGVKGVHRKGGRWVASICKNSKPISIGYFLTKEEAAEAYQIAAQRLHGSFSRTK